MDIISMIINCKSDEELDSFISSRIDELNNSKEPIDQLGFTEYGKSINCYEGFIPLNTRIKYASLNLETYSMNTTDFFYEYARIMREHNLGSKSAVGNTIELFLDKYFGLPGKNDREALFDLKIWESTETDDEYFEAIENNKIGDLKGMGAAECTERAAMAQQLLSFFGFDVYYCTGCIAYNGKSEGHCFNIVKNSSGYSLVDYSITVPRYDEEGMLRGNLPFIGSMTDEEFEDFKINGVIKEFPMYKYVGKERVFTGENRKYVVGKYKKEQEQKEDSEPSRSR